MNNRVVLVTGAARADGVGAACSHQLGTSGWEVVIADSRAEEGAATVAALKRQGIDAGFVEFDATSAHAATPVVERIVRESGRLDALVHCVGMVGPSKIVNMTEAHWDRMLDVNLTSFVDSARAAAASFVATQTRGRIVGIASIAASRAQLGAGAYSAAKAGLIAVTRSLAIELGQYGITANSVSPGFIQTSIAEGVVPRSEWKSRHERVLPWIPIRRIGLPVDVAPVVEFLLSEGASYITGVDIAVDGGLTAGLPVVEG